MKIISLNSTRQQGFLDKAFEPSFILERGKVLLTWQSFSFVSSKTMTNLDPYDAEFAHVQYFDLIPSLDDVDTVLKCIFFGGRQMMNSIIPSIRIRSRLKQWNLKNGMD